MTVTWVDCDGRLSLHRFAEMARARLASHVESTRPSPVVDCEEALREMLSRRLRLYQPPSSRHLQVLLQHMASGEAPPGESCAGGLQKQMLVLDPINAFYWIDMMESEDLKVFKQNCSLVAQLDMIILAAKSPLYRKQEMQTHREYLGDSWSRLVKFRVALCKSPALAVSNHQQQEGGEANFVKPRFCAKLLLPAVAERQSFFQINTTGLHADS